MAESVIRMRRVKRSVAREAVGGGGGGREGRKGKGRGGTRVEKRDAAGVGRGGRLCAARARRSSTDGGHGGKGGAGRCGGDARVETRRGGRGGGTAKKTSSSVVTQEWCTAGQERVVARRRMATSSGPRRRAREEQRAARTCAGRRGAERRRRRATRHGTGRGRAQGHARQRDGRRQGAGETRRERGGADNQHTTARHAGEEAVWDKWRHTKHGGQHGDRAECWGSVWRRTGQAEWEEGVGRERERCGGVRRKAELHKKEMTSCLPSAKCWRRGRHLNVPPAFFHLTSGVATLSSCRAIGPKGDDDGRHEAGNQREGYCHP